MKEKKETICKLNKGRVWIPKSMRKHFNTNAVILKEADGGIFLRPYKITCVLCNSTEEIDYIKELPYCGKCRAKLAGTPGKD